MEKAYANIAYLFIGIFAILIWGFFVTYFGLFPHFKGVTMTQHFHGITFILWFALLIAQPFLIKYKRIKLHKLLGKLSYVLVPIITFSTLSIAKASYLRDLGQVSEGQALAAQALPLPQILVFVVLYVSAMVYRKNVIFHMRYMIASSVVLIGPGLGRICGIWLGMSPFASVFVTFLITDLVLIGLIYYDWQKGRNFQAYVSSLVLIFSTHLLWCLMPNTWLWQSLAYFILNDLMFF